MFRIFSAVQLLKILDKYRPESKQAKKQRFRSRAKVPNRRLVVRQGDSVTTPVEQKRVQLVVIPHDVDRVEVRSSELFSI